MEYEFVDANKVKEEFGELKVADAYNPVVFFEVCIYGEFPLHSNKQEVVADTEKGKVLFTTGIPSFRKTLEDLVSGALQKEAKKQHRDLFDAGLVKAILSEHPEYVIPANASREEILKRFDTPDMRRIIEDFRKNIDVRKKYVEFLAGMWDNSKLKLEKFLQKEKGGTKLYNILESASYSPEQLKNAVSILKEKRKGIEAILEIPSIFECQRMRLQEYLGIVNVIYSRLAVMDSVNEKDFPYFNLKQYFDLEKTAKIKPEEAKSLLDSLDGACKYYSDNCVIDVFRKFGRYCRDAKPDALILPFGADTIFYLGSTKNKGYLLKINGDYCKEIKDKVFNIIVTT